MYWNGKERQGASGINQNTFTHSTWGLMVHLATSLTGFKIFMRIYLQRDQRQFDVSKISDSLIEADKFDLLSREILRFPITNLSPHSNAYVI